MYSICFAKKKERKKTNHCLVLVHIASSAHVMISMVVIRIIQLTEVPSGSSELSAWILWLGRDLLKSIQ